MLSVTYRGRHCTRLLAPSRALRLAKLATGTALRIELRWDDACWRWAAPCTLHTDCVGALPLAEACAYQWCAAGGA